MGFDAGSIEARATLDKSSFDRSADEMEARGKALEDKKLKLVVDADTTLANAKLDETKLKQDALGDSASSSSSKMRDASIATQGFGSSVGLLGTSIALALPLLPELTAGVVALGGVAAAAGAGLGAFGAIALTDITKATNATTELQAAQKAVDNATTPQGRTDALIKQKALIDSLGPSTIALGQAVTGLTGAWSSFAAGFTPEIVRDVGAFTKLMTDAFPLIQPVITAGAGAVSTILSTLDTALKSPGAASFLSWLAGSAEHDILALASAFGHFGGGVLSLFQAFAPVETLVVNGLAAMASGFATWAAHLSSTQGFQEFLRYVATNGPLLTSTLADVATAAGHILAALMPLLPPMLQVLDFFANVVSNVPVADVTFTAIAIGGLFLLNRALAVLIGTSLGGIPALLGFAGAEDAVGASGDAASAKVGGLIGMLSRLGGIGLPAILGGSVAALGATFGPALLTSGDQAHAPSGRNASVAQQYLSSHPITGSSSATDLSRALSAEGYLATGNQGMFQIPDTGAGGSWSGIGTLPAATLSKWASLYGTPADQSLYAKLFGGTAGGLGGTISTADSDRALAAQGNGYVPTTVVGDQTGANLGNTTNDQVPGGFGSYFGNTGATGGAAGGGTGNPAAYTLPMTAGAGSSTAANNAAGLAALLGLNLMQSLAQGIATGTNPLTQAFQNINLQLTGPAQTLGTQLQSIFTNALQLGQQAAQSLAFSVTANPTVGTYTSVYMDAQGRSTTTQQSQLVGSAFNALLTDQKFVADIAKARALGLAPSLLQQFVSAGPSSFSVLDALVNGGSAQISQLNATNAQITALGNTYGLSIAGDSVAQQELSVLTQIRDLLNKAPAAHAAAVAPATGRAVAIAIKKPVAAGARTAVLRPSLGAASSTVNGRRFS